MCQIVLKNTGSFFFHILFAFNSSWSKKLLKGSFEVTSLIFWVFSCCHPCDLLLDAKFLDVVLLEAQFAAPEDVQKLIYLVIRHLLVKCLDVVPANIFGVVFRRG